MRANGPDAEERVVRAFVCIDSRDWEEISRGAARYLRKGEAILAHVVDERAPRGYDLVIRGLLGRRGRRSEEEMVPVSEAAAGELLADAENLLKQLRPELNVRSVVLKGSPNEELIDAANAAEAQTIFIGRRVPGSRPQLSVSGTVRGWKENSHGLFVNGERQEEPYLNQRSPDTSSFAPMRVPKGEVFVMGDNRADSRDSRFFGAVPLGNVEGKAFIIFWPPGHIKLI